MTSTQVLCCIFEFILWSIFWFSIRVNQTIVLLVAPLWFLCILREKKNPKESKSGTIKMIR